MTTLSPGELWLADIIFTTGTASKRRPVLVLWVDGQDSVVAALTSFGPRTRTDVTLSEWVTAGVRKPSTVRLRRLSSLHSRLLIAKIGEVSESDRRVLRATWADHMSSIL
jgi:mRNA interferase MazF